MQTRHAFYSAFSVGGFFELARRRATQELWRDNSGTFTWRDLLEAVDRIQVQCLAAGVKARDVVVTPGEATFDALAWLLAIASLGGICAPLRRERGAELEVWARFFPIEWCVVEGEVEPVGKGQLTAQATRWFGELGRRGHPGLILATGGTSGAPKVVLHDLTSLLATIRVKNAPPRRMLPLMRFDHIGGLDMAWRALAGQQVLVGPPSELVPGAVAEIIQRHRVEILPATPSFLNLMLLAGVTTTHDLSSLRLVPYGAEPMPAGLLARLRIAWPHVEFAQRFGTSETGALPVSDRAAGVRLSEGAGGYSWKVVDGELWILSPARALGYLTGEAGGFLDDGWFRTGDLAELTVDGSIRVLGRRAELINVGGEKVLPGEVENALLTHPLVAECRVMPELNAVVGQVVAAEVVWKGPETDPLEVKRFLHAHVRSTLARHKIPVVVRLVAGVDTTRNLKKSRLPSA